MAFARSDVGAFELSLLAALVITMPWAPVRSLPPTKPIAEVPRDLAEFEGHYEYRDGSTLLIIRNGKELVALIGRSKYLLRPTGPDTFLNPAGDTIPFVRDVNGRIVAFKEQGDVFRRLSTAVPAAARNLVKPRPDGPDGLPQAYRYSRPVQLQDGIAVGAASSTTFPSKVAAQLVNDVIDGTYADVHSLLIFHKGSLVVEEYFYGFDGQTPHEMRSFTKSVISLLAGAAVDRGLLKADEPVLGRLGYTSFANSDPRKSSITLTHLLSNQSGLACNDHDRSSPGNEVKLYESSDWVKAFIDLPLLDAPGTVGRYCSGGFYTAGRAVERAANKPLPEFANEVLFRPLDIRPSDWRWNFELNRSQRNDFGQIYLRPRDMLKLGILILNHGKWHNRQVVSQAWIDAAVTRQSLVDDSEYGLGIWHRWYNVPTPDGDRRVDTILLTGNGGQKVQIVPALDLIAVSTGSAFFVDAPLNEMLARVLLPAILKSEGR